MTKTILLLSAGAAGLLASCEPLPPYPPPGYRPQTGIYGSQADRNGYGQDNGRRRNPNAPLYGQNQNRNPADNYSGRQPVTPPAPPVTRPREEYPSAERTNNSNQVISPYSPYNVIDVEGFRTGQLAKDPSNGKIFRVP